MSVLNTQDESRERYLKANGGVWPNLGINCPAGYATAIASATCIELMRLMKEKADAKEIYSDVRGNIPAIRGGWQGVKMYGG